MKVFCINDGEWFDVGNGKKCPGPGYGDICTVEDEYYEMGERYYNLIEWPKSEPHDGFEA